MAETSPDAMPLRKISDAFKELADVVNSKRSDVEVASFSRASSLVSPLFGCLGIAFKFAEMDYVAKVDDLVDASKSIQTLQSMIDRDVQANTVRKAGSHTRNLLRVKRGLDMVRVLFEQILVTDGNSLKDPASKAYAEVFAPHHGWAIRKAVSAGMYALPTRQQLLRKLNEDGEASLLKCAFYPEESKTLGTHSKMNSPSGILRRVINKKSYGVHHSLECTDILFKTKEKHKKALQVLLDNPCLSFAHYMSRASTGSLSFRMPPHHNMNSILLLPLLIIKLV